MNSFVGRIKNAFAFERVACRAVLSWCCFIATTLGDKNAFARLSWMQDMELGTLAVVFGIFFLLFSLAAILIDLINTDALFLLISSTTCIAFWCINAPAANREWFLLAAILILRVLFALLTLLFLGLILLRLVLRRLVLGILRLPVGVIPPVFMVVAVASSSAAVAPFRIAAVLNGLVFLLVFFH